MCVIYIYVYLYRDVPGIDPSLLPVVRKVLETFSVLSYGDFDEFDVLRNITELPRLRSLNLTEMLLKVSLINTRVAITHLPKLFTNGK